MPGLSEKRRRWEERYRTTDPVRLRWYVAEAPPELRAVLQDDRCPPGAALDVGCGPGNLTRAMAARFHPVVGFDIAVAAIRRARRQPELPGVEAPRFLVAAAPQLPFRTSAFSFVFDRGCLHGLPPRYWHSYFREIDRMLAPGGMFLVYAGTSRPKFSLRRMKRFLRQMTRPAEPLDHRLRRMAPTGWDVLEVERTVWAPKIRQVEQTHALYRKSTAAKAHQAAG